MCRLAHNYSSEVFIGSKVFFQSVFSGVNKWSTEALLGFLVFVAKSNLGDPFVYPPDWLLCILSNSRDISINGIDRSQLYCDRHKFDKSGHKWKTSLSKNFPGNLILDTSTVYYLRKQYLQRRKCADSNYISDQSITCSQLFCCVTVLRLHSVRVIKHLH